MYYSTNPVIRAHNFCENNRKMLEKSKKCACFFCLEIFSPVEINEWADEEKTALCPYCGIDSVIAEMAGFPLIKEFLTAMKEYWF